MSNQTRFERNRGRMVVVVVGATAAVAAFGGAVWAMNNDEDAAPVDTTQVETTLAPIETTTTPVEPASTAADTTPDAAAPADTAPAEVAPVESSAPINPAWSCWAGSLDGGSMTLLLDEEATPLVGVLMTDQKDGATFEYVRLTPREGGEFDAVQTSGTESTTSVWAISDESIAIGDFMNLGSVDCASIPETVNELASWWSTE